MSTTFHTYALDCKKNVSCFLYKGVDFYAVFSGSATPTIELTPFVSEGTQKPWELSLTLRWHLELYGDNQPRVGDMLELRLEGAKFWVGIVQAVRNRELSFGTKMMTVVARSRDQTPAWKEVTRVSSVYSAGTSLNTIINEILQGLYVRDEENSIPSVSINTQHSSTQLADLTSWAMLWVLLQSSGYEPYVDTLGRVKAINRDTRRAADIIYPDNTRLQSINESTELPSVTEVVIDWLNPQLTKVTQIGRILGSASITAGFFQKTQKKKIYYSQDRTQRAENTYMRIIQSCNTGLIDFCEEEYTQKDQLHGEIKVETSNWAPALATASMAALAVSSKIPDAVVAWGAGYTIPVGRVIHAAGQIAVNLLLMCLGTGHYEIWGTPYDYVHARNKTAAYNNTVPHWHARSKIIESDFVLNEAHAQAFAIRELFYEHRSATTMSVKIVDDLRIELGDILQFSDGSRFYVTDYSRAIGPGSAAMLDLTGFQC